MLERVRDDLLLTPHSVAVRRSPQRIPDQERSRVAERRLVTELKDRAITLPTRRDELRLRVGQLRLRTRDVERDPDSRGELLLRDVEKLRGERRICLTCRDPRFGAKDTEVRVRPTLGGVVSSGVGLIVRGVRVRRGRAPGQHVRDVDQVLRDLRAHVDAAYGSLHLAVRIDRYRRAGGDVETQ